MLEFVEKALSELWLDDETLCEVLCYGRLYPLNCVPIFESIRQTGRLITVEEGPAFAAWGAEICAQAACACTGLRHTARVGYDGLIPASAVREAELLPNAQSIRKAIMELLCMEHA